MAASQSAGSQEFFCDSYNCIVSESPCPVCGDKDHMVVG